MSEIRQIQVDGVNYDLVITEDEVAATRAEQAAAQAQASATQAQQFATAAGAQSGIANQAAIAAEDAADRAEAIVGGEFVSYGQAQGLSSAEKQQARDNIGVASAINENILDNAWFTAPVNSRGLTTYTGSTYNIDRWRTWDGGSTVTLTANGLTLANTGNGDGLFQYIDRRIFEGLYGKTVTVSAIINNTLYSVTGVASSDCWIATSDEDFDSFGYICNGTDAHVRIHILSGGSVTVKAVKLELGAVSTLEADMPKNYGEEVTRCIYSTARDDDRYANTGYGRTNPNLLDNWYWVGGGTAGKFPVNQRGQTAYTGANALTFDRWKQQYNTNTQLLANGVRVYGDWDINQSVRGDLPTDIPYTLSVKYSNLSGTDGLHLFAYNSSLQTIFEVWTNKASGIFTHTFTPQTQIKTIAFGYRGSGNGDVIIQAVKLEFGSVSTLAQDGEPSYGEELTKCIYSKADPADPYANTGFGRSNPNLLDNWYFEGGGSQLGNDKYPINQRGQTQYTAAGFVFDRWFKSGGVTATLDAGGLTIVNSNGWPDGINQRFPMHFFAQMNGQAITASVLYANGSVDSGTAIIDATQNYQWLKYPEADEIGFQLKNFQDGAAYDYFDYISFGAGANSTSKKIKAVKLELGTVSTLANDAPPDFGEELRKCQRYFVRFAPKVNSRAYIGTGSANNSNNMLIFVPTPVTLRTTPTISYSNCNCYNWVAGGSIALNGINLDSWSDNGVFVSCAPSDTSQAPQGQPYALRVASGGFFDLSCEL